MKSLSKRVPSLAGALVGALAKLLACAVLLPGAAHPAAAAGLNENCVVSVLNRNVQAKADGTWVLPNLPANFGKIRARATCVEGGMTTYGQSDEFTIPANGSVTLPPIVLGPTTPIPSHLRVEPGASVLTATGATTQVRALATYTGGEQADVTLTGTSYSISNPAIATITPAGIVTAVRSGTVVIQAINEGTTGITQLRVALSGTDGDGDGILDDEELRLGMNPSNPADALLDLDRDGLTAVDEYRAGTNPRNADSDGDGLRDGDEAQCVRFCTSPLLADTDGDGVRDGTEIQTGSDPTKAASVNYTAALRDIRVTPGNFTLVVNSLNGSANVQLTVTGTMIDGIEIDLTSTARQTRYASSNLASCNFGSPDGRVYASSAGNCAITVTNNGHAATAQGTVQDFAPAALSFVAILGFANGVAVSGDFAYVAAGAAGLQVVALGSDRRTPAVIGGLNLGASANDVTVAGNLAYLATGRGLKVVDVTDPAAPRLLGTFAEVGLAMGVKVRGTVAYVAAGDSLTIVSVADPGEMIRAGTVRLGGTAWNLDLDNTRNLAAVAMGEAGLKLVDVSNLSAPLLRGTVVTGDTRGVALRGNTAIVADYARSMTSVDITNLQAPAILSRTPGDLGGLLQNVILSGNFALGADTAFVNGVPIVDISNPAELQPRAILNFTARDDLGADIAADGRYLYLVADASREQRGSARGDSRLYIGQYRPHMDLAGVAPTATITMPSNDTQVLEGTPVSVEVDAQDDITVAAVRFTVNGETAFASTAAPYLYTFIAPTGVSRLELSAVARDLGGNEGTASPVAVSVVPDPLTQVTGRVVGENGKPLAGALVNTLGGRSGTTDANGRFTIEGVPTILGNIVVQAAWTPEGGTRRNGASAAMPAVPGGVVDVGTIGIYDIRFETDYGTQWTTCDDCFTQRTLPFAFPFYGTAETTAFVGTNGYITFGAGSTSFSEYVPAFSGLRRITAFFDDLRGGGGVLINDRLPDRFIVTYDRTRHTTERGSNTLQIQLFRDGRIVFAYKGITALRSGSITGITPGPSAPLQQVDFSAKPTFTVPAGTAVYEYFTDVSAFDMDNAFIMFIPAAGGGYQVRTILPVPAASGVTLSGAGAAAQPQAAATRLRAAGAGKDATITGAALAGAEVRVTSSGNPHYVGMANMDAQGRFTLGGIPAGGINVEVWRNGVLLARGSGISTAEATGSDTLNIELAPAEAIQKP